MIKWIKLPMLVDDPSLPQIPGEIINYQDMQLLASMHEMEDLSPYLVGCMFTPPLGTEMSRTGTGTGLVPPETLERFWWQQRLSSPDTQPEMPG